MADVGAIVTRMRANPRGIRFQEALRVARHYFGPPRTRGSHHFFSTPWMGNPLVNLQESGGMAKAYQVRQLLSAIDRLEREQHA